MISTLSKRLAKIISNNSHSKYSFEIYQYAFFVIFSNILFLLETIILGIVLNVLLESLAFWIQFVAIRQFAGGYHANTELRCEIITTCYLIACLTLIRIANEESYFIFMLFSLSSAILIVILCPIDSPEKALTSLEIKLYKKVSIIIVVLITSIIFASVVFEIQLLIIPSCLSLILESILLIAGKIKGAFQKQKC